MPAPDTMRQHFPYSKPSGITKVEAEMAPASLRWYRITFASTLLPTAEQWRNIRDNMFQRCIQQAAQILYHLSSASVVFPFDYTSMVTDATRLDPDDNLCKLLTCGIDHYFVVM